MPKTSEVFSQSMETLGARSVNKFLNTLRPGVFHLFQKCAGTFEMIEHTFETDI